MFLAPARLDWSHDGADWPNRDASRFVRAGNIEFHVQVMGPPSAPSILLVHGTGASSHSFRDIMPILAGSYRVLAPDLPGHGFSGGEGSALSLPGMAQALSKLLATLDARPCVAVGHSAGTAILIEMALDRMMAPGRIIGFNSALKPIEGDALFSPLAKMLVLNPFVPRAFASFARHTGAAERLLSRTGSRIDARGQMLYRKLIESPGHVSGALGMMAGWDLAPLIARLSSMPCPVTLVAARDDVMVPPSVSREAAALIPGCQLVLHETGGHLLHEVEPDFAAGIIMSAAGACSPEMRQAASGDSR
jgi:magnesium chelatase accessory protein